MIQRFPLVAALALLAALAWPSAPALAAPPPAPVPGNAFAFFPETGHNVGLAIKRFYDTHGGVAIFGLPLTEVFAEDGMNVQYFERARFELHPELPPEFYVSLTLLGRHFTQGRPEPAFQWIPTNPGGDRTYFSESGHTLGGAFRGFWEGRGGLAAFGYPISEEFGEINQQDGKFYVVQYFERARFELHPENAGTPYEVLLGQLGRQLLNERPAVQAHTGPAQPLTLLGSATTGFRTSVYERRENIDRATRMFDGVVIQPGQEHSFLSQGDFSEAAGFVEGYAIVGGRLEKVVGGGLCQVSTTLFRAVSNAGLDVTDRAGHSYIVYFYENILGFDATVFSPTRDFKWRNDSPGPITIATSADMNASTVTFELWGTSDGRAVSYQGPFTKNVVQPGQATWQYDRNLPNGRTTQLVHGRPGMDVSLLRTVTMPDGSVKHNDTFFTRYRPWNDFYTYGAGVSPPASAQVIDPRVIYSQPPSPAQPARSSSVYDSGADSRLSR
jgi:hypothetical protein